MGNKATLRVLPPAETLVEVCCGSFADAVEAEQGGANRVELCSALYLGGLTPSQGSILLTLRALKIPVMVMIRPRPGGFCYSEAEFAVMQQDAELALAQGAAGIVFGFLFEDGSIDLDRVRRFCVLTSNFPGREAVFHRAFDVTPDPIAALDQLIDLGITRVLTSGQKSDALDGSSLIRRLIERAAGRIQVLPGGGIHRDNLADVVRLTGCAQIHLAALSPRHDSSTAANRELRFGAPSSPPEDQWEITDRELVRDIATALRKNP